MNSSEDPLASTFIHPSCIQLVLDIVCLTKDTTVVYIQPKSLLSSDRTTILLPMVAALALLHCLVSILNCMIPFYTTPFPHGDAILTPQRSPITAKYYRCHPPYIYPDVGYSISVLALSQNLGSFPFQNIRGILVQRRGIFRSCNIAT